MARQNVHISFDEEINEALERQFVHAAELNNETPAEALRALVIEYVKRTTEAGLSRDSEEIRRQKEDEDDAMRWIEAHGADFDED